MNRRNLYHLLIMALVALSAESLLACGNQPPVAGVYDYYIRGDYSTGFMLDGSYSYDPDGQVTQYVWNIYQWTESSWSYQNTYDAQSSPVCGGVYLGPGMYRAVLSVMDNDGAWSTNYEYITIDVVGVQVSTSASTIAQGSTTPITITYEILPEYPNFRQYVYMVVRQGSSVVRIESLSDDFGQHSTTWDGKNDSGNWVPEGNYTVSIEAHDPSGCIASASANVQVYEVSVHITSPSSSPAYFDFNHGSSSLSLQCDISGGGTLTWTAALNGSNPTSIPFSDPDDEITDFTPPQAGTYTIKAQYTQDGVTVDDTIQVVAITVDIQSPSSTYINVGGDLSLTCQTTPLSGGTVSWSPNCTPSSGRTTHYWPTTHGTAEVTVSFTLGGVTVTDSISVTAFSIDITSIPANLEPGTAGTLQCQVYGATGGQITWSVLDGTTGWLLDGINTSPASFTTINPDTYTIGVAYTIGSATATDTGDITVGVPYITGIFPDDHIYVDIDSNEESWISVNTYGVGGTFSWTASGPGSYTLDPTSGSNWTDFQPLGPAGDYIVTAEYSLGGYTDTATCTVYAVDVELVPATFSATVELGDTLEMACAISGLATGALTWTGSGPGSVWFSDDDATLTQFAASQTGQYTVRVGYEIGRFSTVSGDGTVNVIPLDVEIDPSIDATTYVSLEDLPLDVACDTPSGTGGTITWTVTNGPAGGSFAAPGDRSTTFTATAPGVYELQVEYSKSNSLVSASDTETCTVVVMDVSVDDCDDYMSCQSATPLSISYSVEPESLSQPYCYVLLRVKDESETAIRTQDLTAQGFGSQQATWDGKLDDGVTYAEPGQYTIEIEFIAPGYVASFTDSHVITLVDMTPNQSYIAVGGSDTILPLTPITSLLNYGELRLTVGPNYDYGKIQLTDDSDNVLTLTNGQLTWNLADPGVQVPSGVHVSIVGEAVPAADQVFSISWWPDSTHDAMYMEVSLKPLRLTLKPDFNRLFVGIPNKITLDYEPATLSGTVTLTVTVNPENVRFWAERGMQTPIQTIQWNLPGDTTKAIYADLQSYGSGSVCLQLDYDE